MLPERDLAKVLDGISPRRVHGYYSRFVEFRHLSKVGSYRALNPKPLWGLGSKMYGGRFTPKGAFETIYLAEDPITAMAEVTGVSIRNPGRCLLQFNRPGC
jgi:RES domain-containing protein